MPEFDQLLRILEIKRADWDENSLSAFYLPVQPKQRILPPRAAPTDKAIWRLPSNHALPFWCFVYDLQRAAITLTFIPGPAETTLVRADTGTPVNTKKKKTARSLRAAQEFQRVHISHADA